MPISKKLRSWKEPDEYDPNPANSRVIITIGENTYGIANYDYRLLKSSTCKKVAKAFENKGIKATQELRGNIRDVTEHVEVKRISSTAVTKVKYEQMSLLAM
jgi:hypothetical protein